MTIENAEQIETEVMAQEPMGDVDPSIQPEEIETVDTPVEENSASGDEAKEATNEEAPSGDNSADPIQKRINKEVGRRKQLEEELNLYKEKLKQQESEKALKFDYETGDVLEMPTPEQYPDSKEYAEKLTQYFTKVDSQIKHIEESYHKQAIAEQRQAMMIKEEQELSEVIPDLLDQVKPLVDKYGESRLAALVYEMDNPIKMSYALSQDMDAAEKFNKMASENPQKAAFALGQWYNEKMVKPKPVSAAPAPVKSVGNSSKVSKSIMDMSYEELLQSMKQT